MPEVRVGVVVASRDGVWALPVPNDDSGLDARAWYETFTGPTFEGIEEFALGIARRIATPELDERDLRDLAQVDADGPSAPVAVFLALTDDLGPVPHPDLRHFDVDEVEHLQGNTTDLALAIALAHLEVAGLRGDHRSPWGPEQRIPARADALALLHECPSDDGTTWTATYVCEVSGEGTVVRGPSTATPTEALAWGRAHADTVLFFVGHRPGRPYNAGASSLTDPETGEPWPTVPDPLELTPRPADPSHHVCYAPLHPDDPPGA